MKSSIAADLIEEYTRPGDLVLDPFCGSGTIPLECLLRGRRALAYDSNPYAVLLTRAKLQAPTDAASALDVLRTRLASAAIRTQPDLRSVPAWVRRFFHPNTLKETLKFADECLAHDEVFFMACLLGILHHQRPGFLSYPSSHLVPYLRERKYPRRTFKEMYEYRPLAPRIIAKVFRALRDRGALETTSIGIVEQRSISRLFVPDDVDAVITSPPYMNALDYVRDNRLRMWLLNRSIENYAPEPTEKREAFHLIVRAFACRIVRRLRMGGHCVIVVGETVNRKRMTSHPAEDIVGILEEVAPTLRLRRVIRDEIPDVRRARRQAVATKRELILVFQRS